MRFGDIVFVHAHRIQSDFDFYESQAARLFCVGRGVRVFDFVNIFYGNFDFQFAFSECAVLV